MGPRPTLLHDDGLERRLSASGVTATPTKSKKAITRFRMMAHGLSCSLAGYIIRRLFRAR